MTVDGLGGSVIDVDGEQLRVAVDHPKAEGPAAIFADGLGISYDYWDPVIDLLQNVTAVRFDRPGLGGSPTSNQSSRDLRHEVERLLAVADEVVPDRDLLLVGHSYGGLIAEATARWYPERTVGLVLVDAIDPTEYAKANWTPPPLRARALGLLFQNNRFATYGGPLIEKVGTLFNTTRKTGPRLSDEQRRLISTPRHLRTILKEDVRLPRHCSQGLELEEQTAMPDIPVQVLVGASRGRPFASLETRWIERSRRRLPQFGPRVNFLLVRSAHLMMFDSPHAVADAISRALKGLPPPQKAAK